MSEDDGAQENRIKLIWDGQGKPLKVLLWDKDGVKHNISNYFKKAGGKTARLSSADAEITTEITLSRPDNGCSFEVQTIPLARDIIMDLPPSTVELMLQFCTK